MQTKDQQIEELTQLNEDLENYFANTIISNTGGKITIKVSLNWGLLLR